MFIYTIYKILNDEYPPKVSIYMYVSLTFSYRELKNYADCSRTYIIIYTIYKILNYKCQPIPSI